MKKRPKRLSTVKSVACLNGRIDRMCRLTHRLRTRRFGCGGLRGGESSSEGSGLRLSAIAIRPQNRNTMAGVTWHYVLKLIITGESTQSVHLCCFKKANCRRVRSTGDAAVGKSSLLIRFTDQRFLANPDPTVSVECSHASGALRSRF